MPRKALKTEPLYPPPPNVCQGLVRLDPLVDGLGPSLVSGYGDPLDAWDDTLRPRAVLTRILRSPRAGEAPPLPAVLPDPVFCPSRFDI